MGRSWQKSGRLHGLRKGSRRQKKTNQPPEDKKAKNYIRKDACPGPQSITKEFFTSWPEGSSSSKQFYSSPSKCSKKKTKKKQTDGSCQPHLLTIFPDKRPSTICHQLFDCSRKNLFDTKMTNSKAQSSCTLAQKSRSLSKSSSSLL